ncbi:MAG: hypothetical protein Q3998_00540 [Porphyromonas sp.]|nr:hypothetical protein [Porphyromonas sp.]
MYRKRAIRFIAIFAVTISFFVGVANAQSIETSPLSRYGYGSLIEASPISYRGMGGVGIGLRQNNMINFKNPAAFSVVDSLSFVFDIALTSNYKMLRENELKKNTLQANIDYLAFQMSLFNSVGLSFGVIPYSRVGYVAQSSSEIEGFPNAVYKQTFKGSGSLQNAYMGVGIKLFEKLSLGAKVNYLFGSTIHEVTSVPNSTLINTRYVRETWRTSTWSATFGAQFHHRTKDWESVLGATLSPSLVHRPKMSLFEDRDFGKVLTPDVYTKEETYIGKLPLEVGIGASLNYRNKLLTAFDVKYTDWESVPNLFERQNVSYKNAWHVALGASYRTNPLSRSYSDNIVYRAGVNFATPHIEHHKWGHSSTLGISLGLGLPIYVNDERASLLNLSLEYVKSLNDKRAILKEDAIKLSVGINFSETWFRKLKIY